MYEIERKFLINRPLRELIREQARAKNWMPCENIQQVYMPNTGKWALRARRTMIGAFDQPRSSEPQCQYTITMKRKKTKLTSIEIETVTWQSTYDEMAAVCGHAPINKNRWSFYQPEPDQPMSAHWMIDEFLNPELDGLVMAEIELPSEDAVFTRPEWLGEEVTGMKGYTNAQMVKKLKL